MSALSEEANMKMLLLLILATLYLTLMTGCAGAIVISTVPIGAGLAVIGLAILIAVWIRSLFGGDENNHLQGLTMKI
jgi:hypothetical protein